MSDENAAAETSRSDRSPASGGAHPTHRVASGTPFIACLVLLSSVYLVLIVLMMLAKCHFLVLSEKGLSEFLRVLADDAIQYAVMLSLVSCTITTLLALWVAVPIGYLMSRYEFRGKAYIDTILDIPIVLPPLVVGIGLLILFRYVPRWVSDAVVYEVPGVILAQFMVACAFAIRTMRVTFDQIPKRYEQVALTLGCSLPQAFMRVVMPQTRNGLLAAATLAWARSLGEFGPILVFAASVPFRTEVLPTSVFLEMQAGRTEGMVAVSIIMVVLAAVVLVVARLLGLRRLHA